MRKLGIRPGHRVTLRTAPDDFPSLLKPLPDDVVVCRGHRGGTDVVLQFAEWRRPLAKEFCRACLAPSGGRALGMLAEEGGQAPDRPDGDRGARRWPRSRPRRREGLRGR